MNIIPRYYLFISIIYLDIPASGEQPIRFLFILIVRVMATPLLRVYPLSFCPLAVGELSAFCVAWFKGRGTGEPSTHSVIDTLAKKFATCVFYALVIQERGTSGPSTRCRHQ